ncbi:MAG: DNA polymerase I [Clostridia bacterium]|nr:DNA polymerase I [Clostridia bacterium]
MDELVIIDGNSLINRAFYALPLLSNSKGEFSNGVYGFANILIKTILDRRPKYIAVCLDYGKKTFRNEMYSGYKAKRKQTPEELKSQFPILKTMLDAMGIFFIEKQGYEADDLIGTLSRKFDGVKNIIVTGDKDALQLINSNTDVWLTKKGVTEVKEMTLKSLKDEMNLDPYQIVELKALMGDSSDNIPGVAGVGEKTALDLLNRFITLDGVYQNLDSLKGKLLEKLQNDKDNAYLSKQLATINTNVDVDIELSNLEYNFPFNQNVFDFFKNYEFNSLTKRPDLFFNVDGANVTSNIEVNKIEIQSIEDLEKQIKHIKKAKMLCFDINEERLTFAYDKNCEFVLKVQGDLIDNYLDIGLAFTCLKQVFEDEDVSKYLCNAKAHKHILKNFNIQLNGIKFDFMLAFYLLIVGEREANIDNFVTFYNLNKDNLCVGLLTILDTIKSDLEKNKLAELYYNVEFPLIDVLYQMENTGFKIDIDILNDLSVRYTQEIDALSNTIKRLAGCDFNINSPKQLAEILFDKLGLVCYNNKKRSTSIEHLEEMFDMHPIIPAVIRYRKIQKINNGYVEAYKNIVSKENNVIHTVFNQMLTATGRLSSSEPNLQNIPVRDDEGKNLRKMFVTSYEDGALVGADYSQIELRLLAHMSQDEKLIKAYNDNIDIHALTASEVFSVDIGLVTPAMRRDAKAVNFGIIYGISDFGLAQNIDSTRKQAKQYIERYFERYPKVKEFMDDNVAHAKVDGYSYSLFNRRRKINELFAPNYMTRQFGERVAMNMPLQGTASDIIKLAMIKVSKALKENNLKSKLILQVHDELIVDAPREEIVTVAKILKDNMENVVKLSVPLLVSVNSGKSWFDC